MCMTRYNGSFLEPVHEWPSAALSVGLACSRTSQYAPRARPPSALHLAIPEQAPTPKYSDTLLGRTSRTETMQIVERSAFPVLCEVLQRGGYELVGPTPRAGAIVYDRLASADDLPIGWTDAQEAGTYRLARRSDRALFGYAVGPHSWKKYFLPPALRLWRAGRRG